MLDGAEAENITAFLFHTGGHADPVRLEANAGKSFVGSYVLGMGFTFDDTDKKGVANPLSEMKRLIEADPRNGEVIFPYIGGEEVNTSPTHAHHRYVINFRDFPLRRTEMDGRWVDADEDRRREWLRKGVVPLDYPEPVASDWPDLLAIVEKNAKPERDFQNRKALRERWWQYAEKRPGLYRAIAGMARVLAISRIGNAFAFTFLSSRVICNEKIVVFPFDRPAPFAFLQSRVHEIWARFFSTTLKDDLQYTPSICFDTFPFPKDWDKHPRLEATGNAYHLYRSTLMLANDEGLTKTYNRFHDPYEKDPGIVRLRELHTTMDRVVLDAYGWTDISADCEFLLDYGIDEATWGTKKKPYRYRWPDETRDEVLARLLALNAERAEEEARARALAQESAPRKNRRRILMVAEQQPLWDRPND